MRARALWDYDAVASDELSLQRDDIVVVERKDDDGWWYGRLLKNDKAGLFPGCYVVETPPVETDELVAAVEARAIAAEQALEDERKAFDAFRAGVRGSFEALECILKRALAPLPGIVIEVPAEHDQSLASGLVRRLKPCKGELGRDTVSWPDFCHAVDALVRASDDDLVDVLERYSRPLRRLFRQYASVSVNGQDSDGAVSPADFLRLCKDTRVCPDLVSRHVATAVCRKALPTPKAGQLAPLGLAAPQFYRALAQCAVAAYEDTMSLPDKVEALFHHMRLCETLSPPKNDHSHHQVSFAADRRPLHSYTQPVRHVLPHAAFPRPWNATVASYPHPSTSPLPHPRAVAPSTRRGALHSTPPASSSTAAPEFQERHCTQHQQR